MAEPRPDEDSPPVPVPAPAPSRAGIALATLAFVLAAAALFGIVQRMIVGDKLEARVKELEAAQAADHSALRDLDRQVGRLGNAVTLLSDEQVDLMNSKLQHLRHGFDVSELAIARQESGVRVVGRLINSSSLRYRDLTFRVKVANSSGEFALSSLPPGASGEFQVVLPNLPLENARTATISLGSSAVEFAR